MELFGQKIIVEVNEMRFEKPGLEIDFDISFNTDSDGNIGNIKIYNLSDKSIENIEEDASIILKAGYKESYGTIIPGVVVNVKTEWKDNDKVTEIMVGENTKQWITAPINKTWSKGKYAKDVAKDIIQQSPFNIGFIDTQKKVKYDNGKTFSTTCKKALEEIASELEVELHVSRSKIYLKPKNKSNKTVVEVNKDTGLIGSPQKRSNSEYKVQLLLDYRITSDVILNIKSNTIDGEYVVKEGKHISSDNDLKTEVVVVKNETE